MNSEYQDFVDLIENNTFFVQTENTQMRHRMSIIERNMADLCTGIKDISDSMIEIAKEVKKLQKVVDDKENK